MEQVAQQAFTPATILAIGSLLAGLAVAWGSLHARQRNTEEWQKAHDRLTEQETKTRVAIEQTLKKLETLASIYIPKIDALDAGNRALTIEFRECRAEHGGMKEDQ